MDRVNLNGVIQQFIDRYEELDGMPNNEGYKWQAVGTFQKYWDIEAEDFPQMFADALRDTSNLIDNATVQPIGGIKMLLSHPEEVEFVRECFEDLFSEDGGDLEDRNHRINNFMSNINEKIDKYVSGSWKYPQSRASVIYYLNLWKPEENYIFKSTEATEWANCIEFGDDFGSGENFSLAVYYRLCEELREAIKDNEHLLKFSMERLERAKASCEVDFDDDLHIMVYDIIYCARAYSLYDNVSINKTSTKERIKRAAERDKKESLEKEIAEIEEQLASERNRILPYPSLEGGTVKHKKYGECKVVRVVDGRLYIDFKGEEKLFQFPGAFESGFMTCEDEALMEAVKNNATVNKLIGDLELKLKVLRGENR